VLYRRVCQGLSDGGVLIPESENVKNYIDDKDCYESLYLYNEDQKRQFDETGSVAGIQDVVTNQLYLDFDSKDNLEAAKHDALAVLNQLNKFNIEPEISFTGCKGFSLRIPLDQYISVSEFKTAVFNLAGDLTTFDRVVNNPSRIIRVLNTKHQDSGLYKLQITEQELREATIEDIFHWAETKGEPFDVPAVKLPEFLKVKELPKPSVPVQILPLDFANKPKFLSNCRWALQNGMFKEGQRSTALLCLASTYKNLGYDQEIVYRMLKGVSELQAQRNNQERFPDEEIYNNIVVQVFNESWKNGQYSCREPGNFLYNYCQGLGHHKCNHQVDDQMKPTSLDEVHDSFKHFVTHIEENTVLTGIKAIDENFFLTTGSNVLILGAAASGKTALALNILNNTSKQGIKSVFASLDMARNRMFEKVMYKITGLPREELYHRFQMDQEGPLMDTLKKEFGNVYFFNKSCPTVQDLREYILMCQETSGERIKLVMVDYFERVTSEVSDDTAASKRVAGELQDLVNDLDVCLITLVQPNKASIFGGPDAPIYNYTAIKGSSFVYQAGRQILSIWRPFATPELKANDHFLQLAILKNDLGEMSEYVFGWNGKRGDIYELADHQIEEFEELLAKKEREKKVKDGF